MDRRITMLAAIGGLIILAASLTTVASSPKISLNAITHSISIPLQTFDIIVTTPTRALVWNFTVDLTGKDAGSDRFNLVVDASGGTNQQVPLVFHRVTRPQCTRPTDPAGAWKPSYGR